MIGRGGLDPLLARIGCRLRGNLVVCTVLQPQRAAGGSRPVSTWPTCVNIPGIRCARRQCLCVAGSSPPERLSLLTEPPQSAGEGGVREGGAIGQGEIYPRFCSSRHTRAD